MHGTRKSVKEQRTGSATYTYISRTLTKEQSQGNPYLAWGSTDAARQIALFWPIAFLLFDVSG